LGYASVSCQFAVTAFLVPAGFLEPRKLQNNDARLRSRVRLRSVCGAVLEFGPSAAFTRLFLLQNEFPEASRSRWMMTVERANPESLTNSASVRGSSFLVRTSSIFLSKKSRYIPRKKLNLLKSIFV
jgi:hypothetical protein